MDRFVTSNGAGKKTGASAKDAAPFADISKQISLAGPGGNVFSDGMTWHGKTVDINAGGEPGKPVTISARNSTGTPIPLQYRGDRTTPYAPPPKGRTGASAFRLGGAASHLSWKGLDVAGVGDGFLVLKGHHEEISVENAKIRNVRKFFNMVEGSTLKGFHLAHWDALGYSKTLVNLIDASDGLVEFLVGDSALQDGDPIAMGVHIEGTSHDILLRDLFMANLADTRGGDQSKYWNGDGFSTERGTYALTFERCGGRNSTDSIFDLKQNGDPAKPHVLKECVAEDATRNYRFWGAIDLHAITSRAPRKHGGRNGMANIWLAAGSVIRHEHLVCDPPATKPFVLDGPCTITEFPK